MNPAEIVAKIDDRLRDIWVQLEDPQGLSTTILKLAVLYGALGNCLAEALNSERQLEATFKHLVDHTKLDYVKNGDSATVAESKAKLDCVDNQMEWLEAQHASTVLKLKRTDTETAIDAARSRLSLIKTDMRQG